MLGDLPEQIDSFDTVEETPYLRHDGALRKMKGQFEKYSLYWTPGNVDPYVADAMRAWDAETLRSLLGKTRKGAGLAGIYKALLKFGGKKYNRRDLPPDLAEAYAWALQETKKAFTLDKKVEQLLPAEAMAELQPQTSAGYGYKGTKLDNWEEIYSRGRWLLHRMRQKSSHSRFDPRRVKFPFCKAAQRGGISDRDDPKTRLIWVYPADMLLVEACYAAPLIGGFNEDKNKNPMMSGVPPAKIHGNMTGAVEDVDRFVGLDISSFDSSVPGFMIADAFDILFENFDFSRHEGKPISESRQRGWRHIREAIVWYFINTPLIMPDGKFWRKYHGVPSGSYFTQLIDSVVNHMYVLMCARIQGALVKKLRVLGDDSIFISPNFSVSDAADTLSKIGVTLSPSKSEDSFDKADLKVLGFNYVNNRKHRPREDDWLEFVLYPENTPRYGELDKSFSRLLGIWLAGGMCSSKFNKFFEYFQSGWPIPSEGAFSRDMRRLLARTLGFDPGPVWSRSSKDFLFTAHTYVY